MFLWLLQWLQRKDSVCDVDCPPGFGPFRKESDDHTEESDVPSALVGSNSFTHLSSSCTSCIYEDIDCIVKSVENELHSSATVSLTEYVEFSVEEEVRKLVKSLEEDKLNEVSTRDYKVVYLYPYVY